MKVVAHDPFTSNVKLELNIQGHGSVQVSVDTITLDDLLAQSDFISLHVPKPKDGALIGAAEFGKMKDGVIVANAARGGVIEEDALLSALDSGKVAAVGLDVFENEPTPREELLSHPKISVTPHIGASTNEAQTRIGIELAEKIISAVG
jgi:D-3-phosphoglycerate dehydrogenase